MFRYLSALLGLAALILWACTVHLDDLPARSRNF